MILCLTDAYDEGYEATEQIRKMETSYCVHIPIFALTAHTLGEEANMAIEARMDMFILANH